MSHLTMRSGRHGSSRLTRLRPTSTMVGRSWTRVRSVSTDPAKVRDLLGTGRVTERWLGLSE
eukprot:4495133-Prymnesium_polylepis.1